MLNPATLAKECLSTNHSLPFLHTFLPAPQNRIDFRGHSFIYSFTHFGRHAINKIFIASTKVSAKHWGYDGKNIIVLPAQSLHSIKVEVSKEINKMITNVVSVIMQIN